VWYHEDGAAQGRRNGHSPALAASLRHGAKSSGYRNRRPGSDNGGSDESSGSLRTTTDSGEVITPLMPREPIRAPSCFR
jgi:hypothetical protein